MKSKTLKKIGIQTNFCFITYSLVLLLLSFVVFLRYKTGIDLGVFTRDPAAIAGVQGTVGSTLDYGMNPFIGVVSNIGILFWCISSSICFFSIVILSNLHNTDRERWSNVSQFFLVSGLMTLTLLLDDLFLFHEKIAPKILNISEKLVYCAYAATIFYWLVRFRKTILKTKWYLLLLAFSFFALSIFMDIISVPIALKSSMFLLEDGLKLLGIVSWLNYFVITCFQFLNNAIDFEIRNSVLYKESNTTVVNKSS